MNPGEKSEMPILRPHGILVALVRINIAHGSSKSGMLLGRTSISIIFSIYCSLGMETRPKH